MRSKANRIASTISASVTVTMSSTRWRITAPLVRVSGSPDGKPPAITPGAKEYAFRFAALSLLAPLKVRARYRLEGFDDAWIEAGDERAVRYTNLPHGDYAFRVIAANDDGVWNRQGATVAFRVEPFFHQTSWFLAATVGAFAFVFSALSHAGPAAKAAGNYDGQLSGIDRPSGSTVSAFPHASSSCCAVRPTAFERSTPSTWVRRM